MESQQKQFNFGEFWHANVDQLQNLAILTLTETERTDKSKIKAAIISIPLHHPTLYEPSLQNEMQATPTELSFLCPFSINKTSQNLL